MIIAINDKNQRVHIDDAFSRQEYFCPCCGAPVVQKRGTINQHHFAHSKGSICTDTWAKIYDMSDWHLTWQSLFPYKNQEIQIDLGYVKHRADVLIGRTVIEFQHSNMSAKNFNERNNFYFNLGYKVIWIFDYTEEFSDKKITSEDNILFTWSSPKKTFNDFDTLGGKAELFFQLKDMSEEKCLVKVSDSSSTGFEQFKISGWFGVDDFLRYVGVVDGNCPEPDRDDIYQNTVYKEFSEKYGISLNKQQERAVQAIDGANLLLAVPGSGKTTVLITRLGYMTLCKGIDPSSILAMTYTRSAARDMKNRFSETFGEELGEKIDFKTINSIADRIIKLYSYYKKSTPFTLISDEKQRNDIIRSCLIKIMDEFPTENDIIELSNAITYIKNMQMRFEDVCTKYSDTEHIIEGYRKYCYTLQKNKLMDFDDQLVYAYQILKKYPNILEQFHNKYKYICIDEAQDTSKIQYQIIKLLATKSNNVFMVGDEDQSIYGFRAAYPQALIDFRNDYSNPFILLMERNYRSTTEIVNVAAQFIKRNNRRYNKNFVSDRGHGDPVNFISLKKRSDQYMHLLKVAKSIPSDTAVLYRDNDCALPLMDLLLRKNIPYRVVKFNPTLFTHRVTQDIKSFIKLANNPFDTDAFMDIYFKLGFPFRKTVAEEVVKVSKANNITIFDALYSECANNFSYREYIKTFEHLFMHTKDYETIEFINEVYDFGYSSYLYERPSFSSKFELLRYLACLESNPSKFIIHLDELSETISKNDLKNSEGIIFSTIHSSKGLEYDSVYLMDVFDGLLPAVDYYSEQYPEERRLFYVAMTRAKNELNIFSIDEFKCSFVDEINPEIINENLAIAELRSAYGLSIPETIDIRNEIRKKRRLEADAQKKRQQQLDELEEARRQREIREKVNTLKYEKGLLEVSHMPFDPSVIIKDSYGNRWVKCTHCGKMKLASEFAIYGGEGKLSLGTCSECNRK